MTLPDDIALREILGANEDGLPEDVRFLATLLSPAPYVPFRLLRRMRRAVLPPGSLDVEARLCASPLVESMADDGFVLEASARHQMHRRLRGAILGGEHPDLADLEPLISAGLDGLPVMIQREAELTWLYLSSEAPLVEANALLLDVVDMVALQGRTRLLTWVAGAFTRLPPDLLHTTGAWVLSQLCAAQDLPYPQIEPPEPAEIPALLAGASWLMPRRPVAFHRDGQATEFARVGGRRRCAMDVPSTSPVLLWVSTDGGPETVVRVDDDSDGTARVATGRGRVSIRAADGTALELAAFDGPVAPEITALDRSLDRIEGFATSKQDLVGRVVASSPKGDGWFVDIEDEEAPWAWLPAAYAQTWRTEDMIGHTLPGLLRIRVERVERTSQRITVRRIRGQWSQGALRVGDRVQGTLVAKTVGRLIFWLNEAADRPQPTFEPLLGVTSSSGGIPRSSVWWRATANRPMGRSARSYPMSLGSDATLVVRSIDRDRRRVVVALTADEAPDAEWPPPQVALGARVTAVVRETLDFGFLAEQVAGVPGLVGLVPNLELSWLTRWMRNGSATEHPLRVGDAFVAVVIGHDHEKQRVHLSLKRLGTDPAVSFRERLRIGDSVDGTLLMRRKGGWSVNIDPWAVAASVSNEDIHGLEPQPRLKIRGTIQALGVGATEITLTDVRSRARP